MPREFPGPRHQRLGRQHLVDDAEAQRFFAPALVALEVDQGLVTRQGAASYGVVLTADGAVDVAATDTLRAKIRDARGGAALPLFDTGGTIEQLRAACEAETGLPAPVQPVW